MSDNIWVLANMTILFFAWSFVREVLLWRK